MWLTHSYIPILLSTTCASIFHMPARSSTFPESLDERVFNAWAKKFNAAILNPNPLYFVQHKDHWRLTLDAVVTH